MTQLLALARHLAIHSPRCWESTDLELAWLLTLSDERLVSELRGGSGWAFDDLREMHGGSEALDCLRYAIEALQRGDEAGAEELAAEGLSAAEREAA